MWQELPLLFLFYDYMNQVDTIHGQWADFYRRKQMKILNILSLGLSRYGAAVHLCQQENQTENSVRLNIH